MSEPCMCGAYDCRRCFPGGYCGPDEDEDLDGGYEPGDPKHSKYRETAEDRADNARLEKRERVAAE